MLTAISEAAQVSSYLLVGELLLFQYRAPGSGGKGGNDLERGESGSRGPSLHQSKGHWSIWHPRRRRWPSADPEYGLTGWPEGGAQGRWRGLPAVAI